MSGVKYHSTTWKLSFRGSMTHLQQTRAYAMLHEFLAKPSRPIPTLKLPKGVKLTVSQSARKWSKQ